MENEPLVSVVIATYNMGQYLPLAVESVLNQEWSNLEVIVVDDGSTDDTPVVMRKFEIDPRVNYIRTKNQGQPKAKNIGIEQTRGDFIGFCDADDMWAPNKLKLQIPEFENLNVGVVYSDVSYIDKNNSNIDNSQIQKNFSGKVSKELIKKNFVPFGTAIIKRSCIEKEGVFNETFPMGIDWDLWLRYSLKWDFKYVPAKTYAYRIWSGQMSKNYRGRYDCAVKILTKFLIENSEYFDKTSIDQAWSDMYVSKGLHISKYEGTIIEPVYNVLIGIRYQFFHLYAWKSLVKITLRLI